jgi:hypothetical protein
MGISNEGDFLRQLGTENGSERIRLAIWDETGFETPAQARLRKRGVSFSIQTGYKAVSFYESRRLDSRVRNVFLVASDH